MPQTMTTVQATQDDTAQRVVSQGSVQSFGTQAHPANDMTYRPEGNGKSFSYQYPQEQAYVPHAQMEPTGHTPSYWRLFTSAGIMRYAFEAFRDTSRDHVKPNGTQKKVAEVTNGIISDLKSNDAERFESGVQQIKNYGVDLLPERWDTLNQAVKSKNYVLEEGAEVLKSDVYKTVRQHEYAHFYDRGLGAASAVLTLSHSYGTAQNIKKLYAETVAMEMDKRPQDVSYGDILSSKNQIVQNTIHNAVTQNALRLGSDAVFFGRSLSALEGVAGVFGRARSTNFAYIGLALKGALLTKDITQKQSTVFETLTGLVDKKINSVHGIADAIVTGDVIDIYQKYADFAKPDNAFLDVTVRQHSDMDMDWPKSERMFGRIADLMNQTYKYKKSSLSDDERHRQSITAEVDFSLPKYVHLLGHGLIDPTEPEQTMTLVEIAARRDMKSLNEAVLMFSQLHSTPEEVAERFGVSVDGKHHENAKPNKQVQLSGAEQSHMQAPLSRQLH